MLQTLAKCWALHLSHLPWTILRILETNRQFQWVTHPFLKQASEIHDLTASWKGTWGDQLKCSHLKLRKMYPTLHDFRSLKIRSLLYTRQKDLPSCSEVGQVDKTEQLVICKHFLLNFIGETYKPSLDHQLSASELSQYLSKTNSLLEWKNRNFLQLQQITVNNEKIIMSPNSQFYDPD